MRLSYDLPSRVARFVFTIVMGLAWSGAARGQPATSDTAAGARPTANGAADVKVSPDDLARFFDALAAADKSLPRDTFDVAAVAAEVGDDPAKALQWVREGTAWVPYRGCLRGPAGTLMDRTGNSLDRATT
jgi:hypothetical protein